VKPWLVLTFAPGHVNDGIGDFSSNLAEALGALHPTDVFVRHDSWRELEGIDPASVGGVIVQYFPQAYLRGDVRHLVRWLGRVRASGARVVTTVHEFWPPADGRLRRAAARFMFRRLLRTLARSSDRVVVTRPSALADLAEAVRPIKEAGAVIIPVGASIRPPGERAPLPGEPVAKATPTRLIMFGQPAAMDAAVVSGVARWMASTPGVSLEWVARSADEMRAARRAFGADPNARVTFSGGVPADELSRRLSAATIGLAPNVNGTSTRRGTFVAFLGHGLPVVATSGPNTGDDLLAAEPCLFAPEGDAAAFVTALDQLTADPARQAAMGRTARAFYDRTLAWPHIAAAYAALLQ
jgi:glycosyltransferase involved in cell wall biosynthesis